jgi:ribosome biogenesis GTPase
MQLASLGWNPFFQRHFSDLQQPALLPARIVEQLNQFHRVRSEAAEYLAEIAGRIRHRAAGPEGLPAVGDWVAITPRPEEGRARIEFLLPRQTKLARKAAGRQQSEQIIATNLDIVFVVSSLNRDLNLRRIERYLSLVWESGAQPVVLLNKSDLCANAEAFAADVAGSAPGVPIHLLSAMQGTGIETIRAYLAPGKTAAFIGSSGVGKSTIINTLAGTTSLRVQPAREDDDRGRHTTTSRQMIFLSDGGIVIDTPGMRELQLWDSNEGVGQTFDDIVALAQGCKFRDCSHQGEPGCEVERAIQNGTLERERLDNHHKLQAELQFHERKLDPRVASENKTKWKKIHKAMRIHKPKP